MMKFFCPECRDNWEADYTGSLYIGLELTCPSCKTIWKVDYKKLTPEQLAEHVQREEMIRNFTDSGGAASA
jgi:phage FluMu protein Com